MNERLPPGMFDGDGGQQLYEAALRARSDTRECLIDGPVEWQFDRYEYEYPDGQQIGVRVAVGVCPKCGQRRDDNAERLESTLH